MIRKPKSNTPQTVHVNRLELWKEKDSIEKAGSIPSLPLAEPAEAAILNSEEAPPLSESQQRTDRIPEPQVETEEGTQAESLLPLQIENSPSLERANENTVMRSDSQKVQEEFPTKEKRRPGRPRKVKGMIQTDVETHPSMTKNNFKKLK